MVQSVSLIDGNIKTSWKCAEKAKQNNQTCFFLGPLETEFSLDIVHANLTRNAFTLLN